MKKILMILWAFFIIFSMPKVLAQNYKINLEYQKGIYYARKGGTLPYKSSQFSVYKFGENIAYCIEPSKNITTFNYKSTDDNINLPLSDEVKEKIMLIGYYGREYPGHDNVRYSMAAQALIWELTGYDTVTFWTALNEKGMEIDVSKERNEILDLIRHHNDLPDLDREAFGYLKREIILKDKSNVLEDFIVMDSGGHEVNIIGNELHIMPMHGGSSDIKLIRRSYDWQDTLVFVGRDKDNSQTLARLRFSKEVSFTLTTNIEGSRIIIHKTDENGNPLQIENVPFKVLDQFGGVVCDNIECLFRTGFDGTAMTNPLYGTYTILESEEEIINGYAVNPKRISITIDYDTDLKWDDYLGNYIDIDFDNQKVTGSVEIFKKGEDYDFKDNQVIYKEKNLNNIEFSLYNDKDKLIDNVKVNENGYAKYDNLMVGKYYLIEKSNDSSYIVDNNKHYFEIKQDNPTSIKVNTTITIKNYLKKGKVIINKIDSQTKVGIPNTKIGLYSQNNELIFAKITDNNGQIMIDKLPVGKYYIKELEANPSYANSNTKIDFEIKDNNQEIKLNIPNDKIKGSVEVLKKGEKLVIKDNEINYELKNLSNITFWLYDNNDKLIDVLKTDSNGYVKYDNLEIGKYYLLEKDTEKGYIIDSEKHYFEIQKENNAGSKIKIELLNKLKKGDLEFSKEDLTTSEGIKDTIIEIYDDNNNLLLTKVTDEEGKIIISKLPVGKYYIIEKEANSLYQLTNEKVFFEIKEDNEIVKASMTNEKKEIKVPKTMKNDQILVAIFSLLFTNLGIVGIINDKQKVY